MTLAVRPALPRAPPKGTPSLPLLPYLYDFREFIRVHSTAPCTFKTRNGGTVNLKFLLLFGQGDQPAATMLFNGHGHSSIHHDWRSFFTGMYEDGAVRFRGFSQPVPQNSTSTRFAGGKLLVWSIDAKSGYLTASDDPGGRTSILALDAQRATHGLIVASAKTGHSLSMNSEENWAPLVKGYNIFFDKYGEPLPHVDLSACMLLCIFHKLLYGIRSSFLVHVFGSTDDLNNTPWVIPSAARARMAEVGTKIMLPYGCSRRYFDVCEYYGSYTMEEFQLFWCSVAPIVFSGAWTRDDSDPYYKMVVSITLACRIIFHSRSTLDDTKRAQQHLLDFAKSAEELMPKAMMTSNLNMLIQELVYAHEKTGAPAGVTNELYIERGGRSFLRRGAAASTNVAEFNMNQQQRQLRLASVLAEYGIALSVQKAPATRGIRDEVGVDGGWFSSVGVPLTQTSNDFHDVTAEIRDWMKWWNEDDVDVDAYVAALAANPDSTVTEFSSLNLDGKEVHASTYTLSKQRNSKNVAVGWSVTTGNEGERELDGILRLGGDPARGTGGANIGACVARNFQLQAAVGGAYTFCGVVTGGRGDKLEVTFTDGEKNIYTSAEVKEYRRDFEGLRARVAARSHFSKGPTKSSNVTYYGGVNRFYCISVPGQNVIRLAFVRLLKTAGNRPAHTVVDTESVYENHVYQRVVPIEYIKGVVIFVQLKDDHGTAGGVSAAPRRRAAVVPVIMRS